MIAAVTDKAIAVTLPQSSSRNYYFILLYARVKPRLFDSSFYQLGYGKVKKKIKERNDVP